MRMLISSRVGLCAVACGAVWSLSACNEPLLEGVQYPPVSDGGGHYPVLTTNREVDILLVVDNSASMAEEQVALASGLGSLLEVLEHPEVMASYRIGITTTDNGNPWCHTTTPEEGRLQLSSCRSRPEELTPDGTEADTTLAEACDELCPDAWTTIETEPTTIFGSEEARSRPWIESANGRTNLPEGLSPAQALQCVAPQGIDGCGYESPLESMWKALRRAQTDGGPELGFVRDAAILSVIHVTDEVDCSYNPAAEQVFLPEGNRVFWSDPAAELPTSAVCWNAGVTCEGTGTYDDCRAVDLDVDGNELDREREDAEDLAVLRPVSRYVEILQELENAKQNYTPDQEVLVSVIGGVRADGSVTYQDAADPQFQQDFGIGPGCEGPGGSAVPPVRLRELAESFAVGDQRSMFSVCEGDYSPALTAIGEAIAAQIRPACFPACVADDEPSTDALEPSCGLLQQWPNADGSFDEVDVPPCEEGDVLPEDHDVCFVALTEDARSDFCADIGFNLEFRFVRREGVPAPERAVIQGRCSLSREKRTDCPDLP